VHAELRAIPFLRDRPVAQVGILVRDLESALARYASLWRHGDWLVYEYGPETVPRLSYRGRPGEFVIRLALNTESPQLELIESVRGPSIFEEWLEERPEGMHHIGVLVDSVDDAVAEMAALGYEAILTGAGYGVDGDGGFAYFDTTADLGLLLEAMSRPKRRRAPLAVIRPPAEG
jgi:methylmalonyl-CoA/ethylmalonyl-CoA epimerase